MVDASPVDLTSGDRTLVGPSPGPTDTSVGGARRSARRVRAGRSGRRTVGAGGSAVGGHRGGRGSGRRRRRRGKRGRRTRRTIISETNNPRSSNNESVERVGPDVGELVIVVHSREAGEIFGGWLVSTSVLHIDLTVKDISFSDQNVDRIQKERAYVQLG